MDSKVLHKVQVLTILQSKKGPELIGIFFISDAMYNESIDLACPPDELGERQALLAHVDIA
jgi:hypothetical protein